MNHAIGSTKVLALAAAMMATGCGASQAEIRSAQSSGYDADFAIVYSQALAAVTALYPQLSENAGAGSIKTAWHPVKSVDGQGSDQSTQSRDSTASNSTASDPTGTRTVVKRFFIRFDVAVVGGNPWRVRVEAQASEWEAGAVPVELKGANEPHWLTGRIEALQVAIYRRLKPYAVRVELPKEKKKSSGTDEAVLAMFADLPGDARSVLAGVYAAAASRDGRQLRPFMAESFSWSLGAEPSAETAIAMWEADPSVYAALVSALQAGCVAAGESVTCPRDYASTPGFSGYRAGFQRGADGLWKMTFFVSGE